MNVVKYRTWQDMPADFNNKTGGKSDVELRVKLIEEEAKETIDAIKDRDIVEVVDGLCDLLYVTYGAAHVFGLEVFDGQDTLDLHDATHEQKSVDKDPDWHELIVSISDLWNQVDATTAAIKSGDRGRMVLELSNLARGCWDAAEIGLGIDLRPFFKEVHRTNMLKLKGPKREDGKQLKPEGWKPPRISPMLERVVKHKLAAACPLNGHEVMVEEHHEGGEFCGTCGGALVDWRE